MRYLPLIGLVAVLAGCGGGGGATTSTSQTTTDANGCVVMAAPAAKARTGKAPTAPLDAQKTYDVVIQTNCGSFTIRLDPKQSPHAVASFVALAHVDEMPAVAGLHRAGPATGGQLRDLLRECAAEYARDLVDA